MAKKTKATKNARRGKASKPQTKGQAAMLKKLARDEKTHADRAATARKLLIERAGKDAALVKVIETMTDAMILGLTDSIAKAAAPTNAAADPQRSTLYARAWSHLKNPRQRAFLSAFAVNGGFVTQAAAAAGIDGRTHRGWREDDPEYLEAFEEAIEVAGDLLEAEAQRRAVEGLVSYKFTKLGDPIVHPVTGEPYYELSFSDALIIKRLEARRPELYRRKQLEVSGPGGAPLGGRVDLSVLSDKELALYEAIVTKISGQGK